MSSFEMFRAPPDHGYVGDCIAGDARRFFHDAVFAGIIAVVRSVDDNSVFSKPRFSQMIEHDTDCGVYLANGAEVSSQFAQARCFKSQRLDECPFAFFPALGCTAKVGRFVGEIPIYVLGKREIFAFVEIPEFLAGRCALMWTRKAGVDEERFARFGSLFHDLDGFVCDPAFLAFVKGERRRATFHGLVAFVAKFRHGNVVFKAEFTAFT